MRTSRWRPSARWGLIVVAALLPLGWVALVAHGVWRARDERRTRLAGGVSAAEPSKRGGVSRRSPGAK